jgi:hypothetical protein
MAVKKVVKSTPAEASCTGVDQAVGNVRDGDEDILAMFSCDAVVLLRGSMVNATKKANVQCFLRSVPFK